MKALTVITIIVIAVVSQAQTTTPARPPHGLVTLKLTWSREMNPPQAAAPRQDEVSGLPRRDNPQANPADKLRAPSAIPSSSLPNQGKLPYYVYLLKVRNEGGKKVRGVLWEYVAADRDNGAELSRRRFISLQEIGLGEVATLRAESPSPPSNVVTTGGLGKDERAPFTSSAEIRCVLYADDTAWEADGANQECAELRRANAQARGRKGKRP